LRLASACYRAGEYEKALEALTDRKDSGSRYWRARNLERLGRFEEAMAELEQVSKAGDDAELASRAKEELEFLRWRAGLKLPQRTERKESSP
jgi:Ca-activated chloride channel family protein